MTRLFSFLLVVSMLAVLWGCATLDRDFEPPRLTLVSLYPISATLLEQKYLIEVRIQNPNERGLEIGGLHYELELNGRSFVSGVSNEALVVPPFSDAVVRTEGVSTLFGLLRQIQELNRGTREALEYRLRGRVSLNGWPGGARFDYRGELFSYNGGAASPKHPRLESVAP
jgi:LEA14-like dessication related protein